MKTIKVSAEDYDKYAQRWTEGNGADRVYYVQVDCDENGNIKPSSYSSDYRKKLENKSGASTSNNKTKKPKKEKEKKGCLGGIIKKLIWLIIIVAVIAGLGAAGLL